MVKAYLNVISPFKDTATIKIISFEFFYNRTYFRMDYFCLESRASTLLSELEEYTKKCIGDKDKSQEFEEIEGDLKVKLDQILNELEEEQDEEIDDIDDYIQQNDHRLIDKSCKHTFNIPQHAFKKDLDLNPKESRELQTFKQIHTLRFGNGTIIIKAETKYKPIDNSTKPHRYLKITVKADKLKNVAGFMQLYNKKISDSIGPFQKPHHFDKSFVRFFFEIKKSNPSKFQRMIQSFIFQSNIKI